VCITLTDEYELDLGAKTQPSINIDDLLFSTYHLMAIADVHRTVPAPAQYTKKDDDLNICMPWDVG
jgi:hypothetical protein